jgi:hypothetical protein
MQCVERQGESEQRVVAIIAVRFVVGCLRAVEAPQLVLKRGTAGSALCVVVRVSHLSLHLYVRLRASFAFTVL